MTAYNPAQIKALKKLRLNLGVAKNILSSPRIVLDFEGKCELNLQKVGAYVYAQHKSCQPLMLSYSLTGIPEDTKLWCMGQPPPTELFDAIKAGATVGAFNSYFEFCVWNLCCVPKLGWPPLHPDMRNIIDISDKCKALALPSNLAEATEVTQVEHVKDPNGKKLIKMFCIPPFANPREHPKEWRQFKYYCIKDTQATIALDQLLPDLSPQEQEIAWLTDRMNWNGIHIDMAACKAADKLAGQIKEHYNKLASELSGGTFQKCTQREKVKVWLTENGLVLPDMQGKTIDVVMRKDDLTPKCRTMLEYYRITGSTAAAKFSKVQAMVGEDGRLHELLNYHKARTGRWGGKGFQIHNLMRPVLPKRTDYEKVLEVIKKNDVREIETLAVWLSDEDKVNQTRKAREVAKQRGKPFRNKDVKYWEANPMQVLTSCLRAVISVEIENVMRCADYSAIEARVLLWLAGDENALDIFRRGDDIYLEMASTIYGIPMSMLNKESEERPLGKETILGAGYGMGHEKFRTRCDEKAGIKITKGVAEKSINAYRGRFHKVPEFWSDLEDAAMEAVRFEGRMTKVGDIHYIVKQYSKMKMLMCRLPSGHTLAYPYPELKLKEDKWGRKKMALFYQGYDSYTNQWTLIDTYGGKLCENVTQAVARDLMAFGMLLVDISSYFLIMTVHDEAASEDHEDFGSLEEFSTLLCTLPKWAGTLPVTSEGWEGNRYRK